MRRTGIGAGLLNFFIFGSTVALTTIESWVMNDRRQFIECLLPRHLVCEHDRGLGDANGYSHVLAVFSKPSLNIPLEKGELLLGPRQQMVLLDFDNRPWQRCVPGQVMGEKPPLE